MPDDPMTAPADFASRAAALPSDDALAEVAWWLSGGVSLLAWTGIALLLTSA